MAEKSIQATKLAQLGADHDIELIDVRTPVEFREVHAQIAKNVPLDQLDPQAIMNRRNGTSDEPLYLICNKGGRGEKACQKFLAAGYDNVVIVSGGTQAWLAAGLPVQRGKKAISLERQVRIAAGSGILVSSLLAIAVHPYFAGIAAFTGAGLVFAGVTDTCGMGMMLAKMPWNQVPSDGQSCALS